jgi:hypothetical protein
MESTFPAGPRLAIARLVLVAAFLVGCSEEDSRSAAPAPEAAAPPPAAAPAPRAAPPPRASWRARRSPGASALDADRDSAPRPGFDA